MRIHNLQQLATAIHQMGDAYQAVVIPSVSTTGSSDKGSYGPKIIVKDTCTNEVVFDYDTSVCYGKVRDAVTEAMAFFGDPLNADPDEVFPIGSEVVVGKLIGKVVGMSLRGNTRRVKTYQIKLYRTNTIQEIESRDVFGV